ncbi:hypothetical protein O181_105003 [Austropuccinia psidii MF-1]|uniref:Retroviral polymerase SH3-like domain-containing protein n=1 Tax=Austropuccinia psidii MF-1 TaxID=1389203 RepID=A0A9Q3JN91_9BASI|nr:hypothetical protein [Austropuccinia psidii MF-1]
MGLPPRINKPRVFGCQAIVMTPKEHWDSKLGTSRVESILLGYENNNFAYRVLRLSDKKTSTSRHVRFRKSVFPQLKQQGNDLLPLNLSWEMLEEPLSKPQLSPTVDLTQDTQELVDEPCNNHPSGVRVFIHTPTQTPQISKSSICISIQFQQSSF